MVTILPMVTKTIRVASSDGYLFGDQLAPKFYHKFWVRVKARTIDFFY
jgi:hypothetical protein